MRINYDKPMSTKVYCGFWTLVVFLGFVVLCNPISMFVFQLFCPSWACQLARTKVFCGEWACGFYSNLALKWPFCWSKFWLMPEDIRNLSRRKQLDYYFEVRNDQEVLNVLSKQSFRYLIKFSPKGIQNIMLSMRLPDNLFIEVLNSYLAGELRNYIWRGTLPKAQQKALLDKAIEDSKKDLTASSVEIFVEYVEKCGLSKEMQKLVKLSKVNTFKDKVVLAQKSYDQKCMVKKYQQLEDKAAQLEWAKYLKKEGGLSFNASLMMNLKQYIIFHKVGLKLTPKVVEYLIDNRFSQEMTKYIIQHETLDDRLAQKVKQQNDLLESYKTWEKTEG